MLLSQLPPGDTDFQIRLAYNQIYGQLTPDQQSNFSFNNVLNHTKAVLAGERELNLAMDFTSVKLNAEVSTPCIVSITNAAVDAVMIVFQVIGLKSTPRVVGEEIVGLLDDVALNRIQVFMRTWNTASNTGKCFIIYQIFAGIVRATGIKKLYSIIKKSMAWYDWALMFILIVAQILLWVVSDGVAAGAELFLKWAILATSITALGVAIYESVRNCTQPELDVSTREIEHGFALAPGESLLPGERITSLDGSFFAILQLDSNFVIYNSNGGPQFASGTYGMDVKELKFGKDGNLCIYNNADNIVWSTGTTFSGNQVCMLSNYGNLILANSDQLFWSKPGDDPGTQ